MLVTYQQIERSTRLYFHNSYDSHSTALTMLNRFIFQHDLHPSSVSVYATRVYVALLAVSMVVLVMYSAISVHTSSVTVRQPSLDTFERLMGSYAATLDCSCTEVSVSHGKMLSVPMPRLHQVRTHAVDRVSCLGGCDRRIRGTRSGYCTFLSEIVLFRFAKVPSLTPLGSMASSPCISPTDPAAAAL